MNSHNYKEYKYIPEKDSEITIPMTTPIGFMQCLCSKELRTKIDTVTSKFTIACPYCAEFYYFDDANTLIKKNMNLRADESYTYDHTQYIINFVLFFQKELSFFTYNVTKDDTNETYTINIIKVIR